MTSEPYQFLPALSDEEYAALRDDIRRRGIQVPVELDEHGQVLDGHHRLRAARELRLNSFPRIVRAGLTEQEKQDHAIALNMSRRHLSRGQRAELVASLRGRGWSVRRIAGVVGVSGPTVLRDLHRAGVSDVTPEGGEVVGADGKRYRARRKTTSVMVTTPHQQEVALKALAEVGERAPQRLTELRRLERISRELRTKRERALVDSERIVLPDGFEVRHSRMEDLDVEPGSVDMVLTDPPYTRESLVGGSWRALGALARTALRPGGLLVCMSPTMWLPQVIADLQESGMDYLWMLAITFPRHPYQVRQRGLASAYRPVLVFRAPGGTDEKVPGWVLDVVPGSGRAKEHGHAWEQSAQELVPLLRAWTRPGDLVLDPFMGTGTSGAAALQAGCRFLGCDSEREWVDTARIRLASLAQSSEPHDPSASA